MSAWRKYQEDAATFFRTLGLDAETDARITGVRTKHDVDVLVRSHHVGFDVTWIVECKLWKKKVSKLHVLGLRAIVADTGADRGILLSEAGFQSGAVEAANLTNVRVTSLGDLRDGARSDIVAMRLRDLFDRVDLCGRAYWEFPKEVRIQHDLRPNVGGDGYRALSVIETTQELISQAFRAVYPISAENFRASAIPGATRPFATGDEVYSFLEPLVAELERRLQSIPPELGSHLAEVKVRKLRLK